MKAKKSPADTIQQDDTVRAALVFYAKRPHDAEARNVVRAVLAHPLARSPEQVDPLAELVTHVTQEPKFYWGIEVNPEFCAVILPDYDGDAGVRFERETDIMQAPDKTLAEVVALADRFMSEVEGPDDVGHEECLRQMKVWLKKHDPENDYLDVDAAESREAPTVQE